jgi:hypothetical protein
MSRIKVKLTDLRHIYSADEIHMHRIVTEFVRNIKALSLSDSLAILGHIDSSKLVHGASIFNANVDEYVEDGQIHRHEEEK